MAGVKPAWREWLEAIITAGILAFFIMTFIGRSYVVEGSSMEPTLHNGERLIIDKISYRIIEPQRGEIIVLRMPGRPYIKRIIAVGGDTIEAHNGNVFVNGKLIDEPYINEKTPGDWGPVLVPKGHYFVMGDNRRHSDDSRGSVGFLPREDIVGRAVFRYWPLTRIGPVGGWPDAE